MFGITLFNLILISATLYLCESKRDIKSRKIFGNEKGIDWKFPDENKETPICEINNGKKFFVSEICGAVQSKTDDGTVSELRYCHCPKQKICSSVTAVDDPFTYATIDNTQYKTCISRSFIPECLVHERDTSTVAKVWYGEEFPLRVLVHCRCPSGYTWGELQCTSSGRICYVMTCEKFVDN